MCGSLEASNWSRLSANARILNKMCHFFGRGYQSYPQSTLLYHEKCAISFGNDSIMVKLVAVLWDVLHLISAETKPFSDCRHHQAVIRSQLDSKLKTTSPNSPTRRDLLRYLGPLGFRYEPLKSPGPHWAWSTYRINYCFFEPWRAMVVYVVHVCDLPVRIRSQEKHTLWSHWKLSFLLIGFCYQ